MRTVAEMRVASKELRQLDATLGLVPTMGALHAGHRSLLRAARAGCDHVTATIFVNPLQFGVHEDLAKYPRTFDEDCAMLEAEGVDVLFAPGPEDMYPSPSLGVLQTFVDVPEIGSRLDGVSRPGHFRGVATVVSKLFHIVAPDRAYFGQKDAAQVAVLRAMVRDLDFDVELVVCPTVREPDGLALSSRNRYLSAGERVSALALSRTLHTVDRAFAAGIEDVAILRSVLRVSLAVSEGLQVDYAEIVDAETLEPTDVAEGALVAVAAWVGTTRLIDNLLLPRHVVLQREVVR